MRDGKRKRVDSPWGERKKIKKNFCKKRRKRGIDAKKISS
jgi:hypothetical protein